MKRKSAFSLMEMMIVLLVVAIVIAATAPMITKKNIRAAEGKSPWVWTGTNNSIAYNLLGSSTQSAIIGSVSAPDTGRLSITSAGTVPQIIFGWNGNNVSTRLFSTADSVILSNQAANSIPTNSVSIGVGATAGATGTVAIGQGATTSTTNSVVIGQGVSTLAGSNHSVAIGGSTTISGSTVITKTGNDDCTAIGAGARAGIEQTSDTNSTSYTDDDGKTRSNAWQDSTAIGANSLAAGVSSTAIGESAHASGNASTALGVNSVAFPHSTAIGASATAGSAEGSGSSYNTAIGHGATAVSNYSTAIGAGASALHINEIVLGRNSSTVYIPGNLVVDGTVILGRSETSGTVNVRLGDSGIQRLVIAGAADDVRAASDQWGDTQSLLTRYSDRRLKNVGEGFKGGLNEIRKLEVFNYTFKKDKSNTPRVGVMAQDLQKIFPNAVTKGDDGFLRIRMEDMFYALINAVKELDAKVSAMAKDIKTVLDDISGIKNKNVEQDKQIAELVNQNKAQQKLIDEQQELIKKLEKRLDKLEK